MEITNEQLQSRIVLLTKCVEYYSDENNYVKNEKSVAPIDLDKGAIAKHTLGILSKLKEQDDELAAVYETLQNEIGADETLKLIKELTDKYKNTHGG